MRIKQTYTHQKNLNSSERLNRNFTQCEVKQTNKNEQNTYGFILCANIIFGTQHSGGMYTSTPTITLGCWGEDLNIATFQMKIGHSENLSDFSKSHNQ